MAEEGVHATGSHGSTGAAHSAVASLFAHDGAE
jgi:hypothetical protein